MYEKEKYAIMQDLLKLLGEIQRNTAPIELSIGRTVNGIVHSCDVLIKKAPPLVTQKLIEAGYSLDITQNGVYVYKIG